MRVRRIGHDTRMGHEMGRRVLQAAQRYEKDIMTFLRELIAIPSFSHQEGPAVERVALEMSRVGFDEVSLDPIGNVVGRIGSGGRVILYDAHIDTVGIGDPEAWDCDPFEGKVSDGVIYGRGASDNKAAVATMVYAARIIRDLGLKDDYTLYVMGVVEEEVCAGWAVGEAISQQWVRPEVVVLGECTDLGIHRGHRGRCEIQVTTKGVSSHGSAPERGVNAIYEMLPLLEGIRTLNAGVAGGGLLDPVWASDSGLLGPGSIAVTMIGCKSASANAIPDECFVSVDRRLIMGETFHAALEQIRSLPGGDRARVELAHHDRPTYKGYSKRVVKAYPAWLIEDHHPLMRSGLTAAEAILGSPPRIGTWSFGTDGGITMGKLGIPTIGFGPGSERWAHTSKDQVAVDHLAKAAAVYALLPAVYVGVCGAKPGQAET